MTTTNGEILPPRWLAAGPSALYPKSCFRQQSQELQHLKVYKNIKESMNIHRYAWGHPVANPQIGTSFNLPSYNWLMQASFPYIVIKGGLVIMYHIK